MVQVPKYNVPEVTPQVSPLSTVNVQTNPRMFGGAMGEALGKAAGAAENLGSVAIDFAKLQQETNARQQMISFVNSQMDKEAAFLNMRGAAATAAYPGYKKDLEEGLEGTAERMTPYARQKFLDTAQTYMYRFDQLATQHYHQQVMQGDKDANNMVINTEARRAGVEAAGSPDSLQMHYGAVEAAVQHSGDLESLPQDQIDYYKANARAKVQEERLKTLVQRDPDKAMMELNTGVYADMRPDQVAVYESRAQQRREFNIKAYGSPTQPGGSAAMSETNNPANLRDSGAPWQGKTGTSDKGFVKFDTLESGGRAGAINLVNQARVHGIDTVEGLITKYAPKNENDTEAYETFVAKQLGVGKKEKIDLTNPDVATKAYDAILRVEQGGTNPFSPEQTRNFINLALGGGQNAQGLIDQARGNPRAQLEIARNTQAFTTPAQDDETCKTTVGEAQQRCIQAVTAKRQVLGYNGVPGTDPAGYMQQQSPELSAALTTALQKGDGAGLHAAVDKLDKLYTQSGSPNSAILSNDQAKLIASSFATPKDFATWLDQSKAAFGDNLQHRLVGDLVKNGGLPAPMLSVMAIDDPKMREVSIRANTDVDAKGRMVAGVKDFSKLLPDFATQEKTIKSQLAKDSDWNEFVASLPKSGFPDSQVQAYTEQVQRLALQLTLEGEEAGKAARDAAQAYYGQFHMLDSARVPKDSFSAVHLNATDTLMKTKPEDLMVPYGVTDPVLRNAYHTGVVSQGYWGTNKDGTAAVRYDQDARIVQYKDGRIMQVPFDEPARGDAWQNIMYTPYVGP